tara:strand:- start:353 stop:2113 length:1761 start_codon:yes stop_codon:yes gene_type:complete
MNTTVAEIIPGLEENYKWYREFGYLQFRPGNKEDSDCSNIENCGYGKSFRSKSHLCAICIHAGRCKRRGCKNPSRLWERYCTDCENESYEDKEYRKACEAREAQKRKAESIQKKGAKKPRGGITPNPNPVGLAQAMMTVAAVTIGKTYQQHVDAPVEEHVLNATHYTSFEDFLAKNSSESLTNTNIIICPGNTTRIFCGTIQTIRVPGDYKPDCRPGALNHTTNGPPGTNYGEFNGFLNDFGANLIAITKLLEVIPGLYDLLKVVYGDTFLLAIDRFSTRNKPADFDLKTPAGKKNLKDNLHVDYNENGRFEKRDGPLPPLHTVKTPKGFITVVILYQALDHSIPMGGSGIFPYISPVQPIPYQEDTLRIWGRYYDKTQVYPHHPYLHNTVPTQRAKTMLKGKKKGTFFVSRPNAKNKKDAYTLFFVNDSQGFESLKLNGIDQVVSHIRENEHEHLKVFISPEESKVYAWKDALKTLGRNPDFNTLVALFCVFQLPPVAYPSGKPIQLPLPPYAGPTYKLFKGEITPDEKLLVIDPKHALATMTHPSKPYFEEILAKFPDFKWATDPSTLDARVLSHMFAPAQGAL